MAIRAFLLRLHRGSRSLWLMMIEVEVAPAPRGRKTLRVFDRHIGAIKGAREITASRRLGSRTIGVLRRRQRELQLLEEDGPVGKCIRLLVYRVGSRIDVDIVIFREAAARPGRASVGFAATLTTIKRYWSDWMADVNPC